MSVARKTPTPGSKEAKKRGCICPTLDNNHGAGAYDAGDGPVFFVRMDCPMHGDTEEQAVSEWNHRPIEDALMEACELLMSGWDYTVRNGLGQPAMQDALAYAKAAIAIAKAKR